MSLRSDTIAAIATPLGEGGIAVLRISGPHAIAVASKCLRAGKDIDRMPSHTIRLTEILGPGGAIIDQALVSVFRAPQSYTGEDSIEISCHGGMLVSRRALESVLSAGARHAEPGEFTKRAFLNGKLDLAQAEAVAELIHATSDKAHRTSLSHLQGEFSQRIEDLRNALMDTLGLLELELDFAEDGYELIDKNKIGTQIEDARQQVDTLIESYTAGKVIREGVNTVLVGAPNAGKSSLMNRLLRESRAIVTEVPGTTRDVISENITIKGVLFRLSDTAGIRYSEDIVEKEGVRRSKEMLSQADVIIFVLDGTRPTEDQIREVGREAIDVVLQKPGRVRLVVNKIDIVNPSGVLPSDILGLDNTKTSRVSAKTGEGILELEQALLEHIPGFDQSGAPEGEIVTTARHYDVFRRISESLTLASESLQAGKTGEFIALDLRNALDGLGEIVGKVTNEDVLNRVFSQFCIGK